MRNQKIKFFFFILIKFEIHKKKKRSNELLNSVLSYLKLISFLFLFFLFKFVNKKKKKLSQVIGISMKWEAKFDGNQEYID